MLKIVGDTMREVLDRKPGRNREPKRVAGGVIDLGPEGGDGGGDIVAAGTPEDIAREKRSYTGAFLKPVLARRGVASKKKRVEAAE